MEEWQQTCLDNYLIEISKYLEVEDTLMRLTVHNIFDVNDTQLVQNGLINKTDAEKRQKIIEILKRRGSDAYWEFCHIIRQKTPQLFSMLHDVKGYDTATTCTKCINGEDAFFECSYCKGLVNFLSNPRNGVFIDKPEDIIELFKATKEKMEAKDSECKYLTTEISKLTQERHELLVRHVNDLDRLNIKEKELKNKDKEYETLLVEKDNMVIQKEELQIKIEQLQNIITTLEKDINENQIKLSEHQNYPIYENQQTIEENAIKELKSKLLQANHKNEVLNEDLVVSKKETSRLKIKFEALESASNRQKRENDRVFEDLTNNLDDAQKQYSAASMENDVLKEQIKISKIKKEEAMKERDHLLEKVYEKDKLSKNATMSLCTAEQNLKHLQKLSSNQIERVKRMQSEKEELMNQYKTVIENRNELQRRNEKLLQEIDNFAMKLMNSDHSKLLKELQSQVNECMMLRDEVELWKKKFHMLPSNHLGDTEVVLQKNGGTFGVRFGHSKGPAFLGESSIVIAGIKLNHQTASLSEVRDGDFVIAINDVNVQESNLETVRRVCDENTESMKLLLRKRIKKTYQDMTITFAPSEFESLEDIGLKVGVFCQCEGRYSNGIQNLDKILKINGEDADSLPVVKVKSILTRMLQQKQKGNILVRRYQWKQSEGRIRSENQLSSVYDHTSKQQATARPRSVSHQIINRPHENYSLQHRRTSVPINLEDEPLQQPTNSPYVLETELIKCKEENLSSVNSQFPDLVSQRNSRSRKISRLTNLDYSYDKGDYSYVESYQFDSSGGIVGSNACQDIVEITLEKKEYESFGFQMIGGNKTGIFVSAVDAWRPAEVCGMEKGWKILKINKVDLKGVAFCFAVEVLKKFSTDERITFVLEKTLITQFEDVIKRKPYDSFHVKALVPYTARCAGEMSFLSGDILCVTNSHVIVEPGQPYKWNAIKEKKGETCAISGLIPRQISSRSPTAIEEHLYTEICEDLDLQTSAGDQPENGFQFYYELTQSVGQFLV
ncbi:uncharacterized protein LOC130646992 [Hydractinia symbiolongicarpus]|uniref:uncharacterized protein LOC130646992 n=1 Tax=Hydractinia symbiolongicarpus TaxID=13093 RepID=UPI00254F64F5|nr:uncharacterized protein LOC130646992 [Hydractinia symbiolongicarpus]